MTPTAVKLISVIFFLFTFRVKPFGSMQMEQDIRDREDNDGTNSPGNIHRSERQKRSVDGDYLKHEYMYGAVVDAGSSGSRLYVYRWRTDYLSKKEPLPTFQVIQNKKIEGGVSLVESDVEKLSGYLRPFIDLGKRTIPQKQHNVTNLYFMSTAGMRFLLEEKANRHIKMISNILANKSFSPFVHKERNVRILSDFIFLIPNCIGHSEAIIFKGEEEGAFAWLSVNYNKKIFFEKDVKVLKTHGIIEMGGASAQIAFIPDGDILEGMFPINVAGITYRLYVHSFLHYGQEYAERWVNEHIKESKETCDQNKTNECSNPCYIRDFNVTIKIDVNDVHFVGSGDAGSCEKLLDLFVYTYQDRDWRCSPKPCSIGSVYQPSLPASMDFYGVGAFRYTYERFDLLSVGNHFDLDKADKIVRQFCAMDVEEVKLKYPSPDHKYLTSPCLLGMYFTKLFNKAFKFPMDTKLIKIEKEIDWTLGALLYEHELYTYKMLDPAKSTSAIPTQNGLVHTLTFIFLLIMLT
ncbi:hypothetical protein HELRODRAFT_184057 [Helobdella robusta]|uniref:Ectonucleoside triphosphate diphosphohydrolase 1 n=1 Tax=Helobdella robusta TaxID=6412 RepID=T1FKI0_HELRO|nr:hypothetical protein HELRODRAFT_184057 [Helobdella robusta]ESO08681.1 hypothetical protein HELRODRAFT_184057 [Helobdella robusta]